MRVRESEKGETGTEHLVASYAGRSSWCAPVHWRGGGGGACVRRGWGGMVARQARFSGGHVQGMEEDDA